MLFTYAVSFSFAYRDISTGPGALVLVASAQLLMIGYLLLAGVTIVTESEVAWLFIAAGVLVWLVRAPPKGLMKGGGLQAIGMAQLPAAPGI